MIAFVILVVALWFGLAILFGLICALCAVFGGVV